MNAGFFPIIIADTMFSRFIALSRLPYHLDDWLLPCHARSPSS